MLRQFIHYIIQFLLFIHYCIAIECYISLFVMILIQCFFFYKVTVEVLSSVLLGELRADVTSWWHKLVRHHQKSSEAPPTSSSGGRGEAGSAHSQSSLQAAGAGKSGTEMPHVRMMANGQELGTDLDKKTLHALQFKNEQVCIYRYLFLQRML